MYPYLFGVEKLPMYGILLALGLLGAMLLFKFICAKKKVDDKSYSFYSLLGIISIAAGLLGAYLFQAVYNAIYNAINHTKETGGLTFMGGLITGVAVFILGALIFAKGQVKRDFFKCASYAAPCIVLGHTFGRLGCFCAGCCYGKATNSALGIVFPDLRDYPFLYSDEHNNFSATGGRAYPTQLFEAIFLAVLLSAMLIILFRFDKHKLLLPLYGIAYSVWRFCIEYLRGDYRGSFIPGITPSQMQVILLFAAAVALSVLVYKFNIIPFAKAKDPAPKKSVATQSQTNHEPVANVNADETVIEPEITDSIAVQSVPTQQNEKNE